MNIMINEKISAYLDGEATPQEVENTTAALLRDPALRGELGRQHWLRHALRDSRPLALDAGFSSRVLAGLDAQDEAPVQRSNVAAFRPRKVSTPRWYRQAAGLAVAASVIGAVVLVSNPLDEPSPLDDSQALQSQNAAPVQQAATFPAATQQVALQQQQRSPAATSVQTQQAAADHWAVSDPDLQDQLNGYLLEHDGLARGYGLSGATPSLVRVATYRQVSDR